MSVVFEVGQQIDQVGERVGAQVRLQLAEGDNIRRLRTRIHNISQIGERIVVLHIRIDVSSQIAGRWQTLVVGFPGLSRQQQRAHNVVIGYGAGESIIIGLDLSRRQHEVVADGRMGIGKVVCCQRVLRGERIEIRHGCAAYHLGKPVVLKHNQKYMIDCGNGDRRWCWRG